MTRWIDVWQQCPICGVKLARHPMSDTDDAVKHAVGILLARHIAAHHPNLVREEPDGG